MVIFMTLLPSPSTPKCFGKEKISIKSCARVIAYLANFGNQRINLMGARALWAAAVFVHSLNRLAHIDEKLFERLLKFALHLLAQFSKNSV